MAFWIETKVCYEKLAENGKLKKVTEHSLVEALSFTEAEARITAEVTPFISGDFTVSAVKKSDISEIFRNEDGDKWYKVKVAFITIDEKSACEKRSYSHILVHAQDFENALDNFLKGMKGTVADFEIAAISETKILDVYNVKLG